MIITLPCANGVVLLCHSLFAFNTVGLPDNICVDTMGKIKLISVN